MNCLITSTAGDTGKLLERLGYLAVPTDVDNVFDFVVESAEDLFHLMDIIGFPLFISGGLESPLITIHDDLIGA